MRRDPGTGLPLDPPELREYIVCIECEHGFESDDMRKIFKGRYGDEQRKGICKWCPTPESEDAD